MKSYALAVLLVLVAVPAFAQTPIVQKLNKFEWQQVAPDLATAQGYAYTPREGITMLAALTSVSCVGTASPFTCKALVGDRPAGPHTYTLVAIDVAVLLPLESAASNAYAFTFRDQQPAPTDFRIVP